MTRHAYIVLQGVGLLVSVVSFVAVADPGLRFALCMCAVGWNGALCVGYSLTGQ